MLKINNVLMKSPSSFSWGLDDLSSEDSNRTLDGISHKDRIAQKRKLECSWVGTTREETATLLQAVNATVYFNITYPDAMSGMDETRRFYVGPRSAGMQQWTTNNKTYSSVSFNFVEE